MGIFCFLGKLKRKDNIMKYKPDFVYTGNKWGYVKKGKPFPINRDSFLLNIWKELNQEVFNGVLHLPDFIVFAKYCFQTDKINIFGGFQSRVNVNSYEKSCGITISYEYYLARGIKGMREIILHEMVHQYCFQNNKNTNDNSIDFVYYSGWFRSKLHFRKITVTEEIKRKVKEYDSNGIPAPILDL